MSAQYLEMSEDQYQIFRAIAQLNDNPESLDSVLAQLRAYLTQTMGDEQTKNRRLYEELKTLQTELNQLGKMMAQESTKAKNHHVAICQHVERILRETKCTR